MQKVDFYILDSAHQGARLEFSIKLAEQLYRKQLRIHLNADSSAQLKHIDEQLWSGRDVSFVPHEISNTGLPNCPITLSVGELASPVDILINLGRDVPPNTEQAERIVEIINRQDPDVAAGRGRYRYYKDREIPITNHEIKS